MCPRELRDIQHSPARLKKRKDYNMLGWMILFALMSLLGMIATLARPAMFSALGALMFGFLFLVGLLTRLVRGRGW